MTDEVLGVTANPIIKFKTLQDIVSSQITGRADNALCSACHSASSSKPYHAPAGTISPVQVINGWT